MVFAMKTVVITGAARGIGRACALAFRERGWFVVAVDVDDAGLATLAPLLGANGNGGVGAVAHTDVTDYAAVSAAVEVAVARGGLDAFVNNAGVLSFGAFVDVDSAVDIARAQRMVSINVAGVVNGARAALPALRKTGGTLVSLSSAAAIYGTPDLAVYSATKAFVSSLTEGLAIEESRRPDGDRARVVDVLPGFVDTDMVRVEQKGSRLVERLGVKLKPEDVARAIVDAVVTPGPVHHILNLQTRLQQALVGMFPGAGALLVKLVERGGRP